ncbi:MAG TPA: LysM domain-containing protein, partial [Candidatus Kapabacteria bacterium]|nr:LysM domain-containing protein [Candidatus Kapabacteria bacterium]
THNTKYSKQLASEASDSGTVHHRVQEGETLYSIASAYNTTVSALQHDNRIEDVASIHPGTVLIIHGSR